MRTLGLLVILASFAVTGCSDDGGSTPTPDAAIVVDASPDAPAALAGLGQTCVLSMMGADCPTNAPGCLGPFVMGGTVGICTNVCVSDGTFRTNAQSVPENVMPSDLTSQNAMCAGIYTGGASGTAACNIIFGRMPTGALMANTNYTFQMACGIACGTGNTCPSSLTCNTTSMRCEPM
ncbi:MAG: hypothetical protein M3680_21160 [Myxococcota bacterium]|nr:hypothetical protein [Myxococcota bacterium]